MEGQGRLCSIYMIEDDREFASFRTVRLGRWRQDLGSQLDHGPDTRRHGQTHGTPLDRSSRRKSKSKEIVMLHGCSVVELRQYTLHDGTRDRLVDLFENEFI